MNAITTQPNNPLIDLHARLRSPLPKKLSLTNFRWFQRFLGITQINSCYQRFKQLLAKHGEARFWESALEGFDLQLEIDPAELANIPTDGPLVLASNHPFGPIDGFVLGGLIERVRGDMKMLGIKDSAELMPDLASRFIPVDLNGDEKSKRENATALKNVFKHVRGGGCLGIFPSGRVMEYDFRRLSTYDPEWHPNVAAIARKAKATVVPVWIEGRNSLFYHIMGTLISPTRLPLMVRELGVRKNRKIKVRIGKAIQPETLAQFESNDDAIKALQETHQTLKR